MKQLTAIAKELKGNICVQSPGVGKWIPSADGIAVSDGILLGWLQVLGQKQRVVYKGESGSLFFANKGKWVSYNDVLGELKAAGLGKTKEGVSNKDEAKERNVFRSPTSGRFYSRPAPDKPKFVEMGNAIKPGQVVCLLEVMKTFNRIEYDGSGEVVVKKILVEDGGDVEADDPLYEFE